MKKEKETPASNVEIERDGDAKGMIEFACQCRLEGGHQPPWNFEDFHLRALNSGSLNQGGDEMPRQSSSHPRAPRPCG
jgi:hypothetical protein